jgi:hypothetical protein
MTFDAITEKELVNLHPEVVIRTRIAGDALMKVGIQFRVYSGLRTSQQQADDYAKGRNGDPRPRVTNAKPGESSHNHGLAIDAVPFVHGDSGPLDWNPNDAEYKTFVQAMLAAGLKWGGNWKTFKDMDHFYIGPDSPTPAMKMAYDAGTPLTTIWNSVEV